MIKNFLICAIVAAAFIWCWPSYAEGGSCPDGYYPMNGPGVQGCAPIPNYDATTVERDNGPLWQDRWIAIAVDGAEGVFGAAKGLSSRRKAVKAALEDCTAKGGTFCKPYGVTYNQCIALVSGRQYINSYGSPRREQAEEGALNECSAQTTNCQIFYSECSFAEQVR